VAYALGLGPGQLGGATRGGAFVKMEAIVAQKIRQSVQSMVDAAKRAIEELPAAEAIKLAGREDVVLVDLRDPRERERDGTVPGTFNVTRGMLEFWIDPASPYYKPRFGEDKKFVFFCAGGLRSALAAKTAQDMGLKPVAHILGGFKAWKEAGGPVEGGDARK
jgi:rhodanese-related sulfurtransferase